MRWWILSRKARVAIVTGGVFLFIAAMSMVIKNNDQQSKRDVIAPSDQSSELMPAIQITEDQTPESVYYEVVSVIDGDTIKINYSGTPTSLRLIGVNAPETVDPRTTVECFGKEASDFLNNLLSGKKSYHRSRPHSDRPR